MYHQIQTWLVRPKSPLEWGWIEVDDKFATEKTTLPAAPDRLLKMIRCSCKQNCETKRCTCRKHGLLCTTACGECHGLSCSNKDKTNDELNQE